MWNQSEIDLINKQLEERDNERLVRPTPTKEDSEHVMRTPDGNILSPVTHEEAPEAFPDTSDKAAAEARYVTQQTLRAKAEPTSTLRKSWDS